MNDLKNYLSSTIITWILIVIIVLAFGCYLLTDDGILHFLFEGDSAKTKADLLTIYLGVIGGLGVLYGFYINNKKLEEQNRQNKIAEDNRNDKRFTDAIIFLKDDNPGVVLSAVKTLFQIAQQDKSYKQIVAVLFCEYLNRDSQYCKDKRVSDYVVKCLLQSNLFNDIKLELYNAEIILSLFGDKCISSNNDIYFSHCSIINAEFNGIKHLNIQNCEMNCCTISEVPELFMVYTKFHFSKIDSTKSIINYITLGYCEIDNLKIKAFKGISYIELNNNTISDTIEITSPKIQKKDIKGCEDRIRYIN